MDSKDSKIHKEKAIEIVKAGQQELENVSAAEIIKWTYSHFPHNQITIASSFSIEDQAVTDLAVKEIGTANIFSLDTGRLNEETYTVMDRTREKYSIDIDIYCPAPADLEPFLKKHGTRSFYKSPENRKECCRIRKTLPLKRALKGMRVWICGLRQQQSVTRTHLQAVDWDEGNGLIKVCPIAKWSEEQTWDYIRENNVPYNKLYDKGYASIGCAPCTRAIDKGEDVRAGRWWWENPSQKECGIHLKQ